MHGDLLFINKNQILATQQVYSARLEEQVKPKTIITVTGEVESGKTEIAHLLGKKLSMDGFKTKVLNLDSFYKIIPKERHAWRKKEGLDKIGPDEYDWDSIKEMVLAFKKNKKVTIPYADVIANEIDQLTTDFNGIDVLIINGLYAVACTKADLNIFIERSYEDSLKEQQNSMNENLDEWRYKELKQEHEVVTSLKHMADYFIDLDTSQNIYHI
ncbi:MAG: uridine kinase [Bacteroidota bacterium]|nr:uridine kinase [Bacteroidota bacterium]